MSGKRKKGAGKAAPRAYGRLTRQERNTVQRMLERGASCRQIARELGRSTSTVSSEVASHRFVTAPRERRGERVDDYCSFLFGRPHRHYSTALNRASFEARGGFLNGNSLRLRKLKLRRKRFKGKGGSRNTEFIRECHTARTGIPFCIAFLSTPMHSSNLCLAQHPSQHSRSITLALFFVGPPAKNKSLDFYLAHI